MLGNGLEGTLSKRSRVDLRTLERVVAEAELLDDVLRDTRASAPGLGRRTALRRGQQLVELLGIELLDVEVRKQNAIHRN